MASTILRRLNSASFAWLVACAGAVSPAMASAAQGSHVLGSWDVTITSPQGPTSSSLVLKQEGDQIVGTLGSPQGDQRVEASVKEKAVTIWFSVRTQNGPIGMTMNGTVDGDTMKGSMDFGGRGQSEWFAKRRSDASPSAAQAAEARVDVSGAWNFQVETGAGSGTPSMTFKQDGEKLTGQYTGQFGEAPLTGTIKGNAIEFAIDVSLQDTALHIVYSGTVDKNTMKGSVKLGDLGEGTFTAKKKT